MEYERYPVEELGFTGSEIELFLGAMQGVTPFMNQPFTSAMLKAELTEAAVESHEDIREFGVDLSMMKDGSIETPYFLHDLAEKIARLTDDQAIALRFFSVGYWSGIGAAANQAA